MGLFGTGLELAKQGDQLLGVQRFLATRRRGMAASSRRSEGQHEEG